MKPFLPHIHRMNNQSLAGIRKDRALIDTYVMLSSRLVSFSHHRVISSATHACAWHRRPINLLKTIMLQQKYGFVSNIQPHDVYNTEAAVVLDHLSANCRGMSRNWKVIGSVRGQILL